MLPLRPGQSSWYGRLNLGLKRGEVRFRTPFHLVWEIFIHRLSMGHSKVWLSYEVKTLK